MALFDVIKYEGSPEEFVWKHPSDGLRWGTHVVVNESQEVVLYKDGKAFDVLGPGKHIISSKNIPLLNHIVNIPFGNNTPFKVEIWYINKIHSNTIKWGTPTPIQLQDPQYKIVAPVSAFGRLGIQICDSKTFLTKMVGTLPEYTEKDILEYFKGVYITKVKDTIAQYVIKQNISVLHINAYLDEISDFVKEKIDQAFEKYGVNLVSFKINDISVPDDDPAVVRLKNALAHKAEMDVVGFDYNQERSFDTLQKMADASSSGSGKSDIVNTGMGLSMGMGIGNTIGNMFNKFINNAFDNNQSVNTAKQQEIQSQPIAVGTIGLDQEPEQPSEYKEPKKFNRFIGQPLSVVIPALEKMGYVDRESIDADEHPVSHLYNITSVSDNGQQILWPNNWTVTAISLDEHKRSIVIDVARRIKRQ